MTFNSVAGSFPRQDEIDLSKPLGLMLETAGIFNDEQVDLSGIVQSEMVAIRSALEDNTASMEDVKAVLGEDRNGQPDISKYAKQTAKARQEILETLNIKHTHIENAQQAVSQALRNRSNINDGHTIQVPAVGFIHMDLHGKDIKNLGQLKQAALLSQRAIDAVHALNRMEKGEHNADKGAARGFKLWGDESPELADAVTLCSEINALETAGIPSVPAFVHYRINSAFDAARQIFKDAGYPDLAKKVANVQRDRMTAQKPESNVNPTNDGGDAPGL